MTKKILYLILAAITAQALPACKSPSITPSKIEKLCIEKGEKEIGKSAQLTDFCQCAAPKIYEHFKDDPTAYERLLKDETDWVSKAGDKELNKKLEVCQPKEKLSIRDSSMKSHFSHKMEKAYRMEIMTESTPEFKAAHDMDKYCDCYIEGLKTRFTVNEFIDRQVKETPKYKQLIQDCEKQSKQ